MIEKKVIIKNETGLHARPAASVVQFAKNFQGSVQLVKDGKVANSKSIFNVMALGVAKDQEIIVRVNGEGEEEFIDKLIGVIENLADWI